MKFLRFKHNGHEQLGIFSPDEKNILSISSVLQGKDYNDMNTLIEKITSEEIQTLKEANDNPNDFNRTSLDEVELLSPIERPIHDIICIGLNYADHIGEVRGVSDKDKENDKIAYFSKRASTIIGSNQVVKGHFDLDPNLDYEVELAVIIGKRGSNIKKDQVQDYIFGYSVFNDLSARQLQMAHNQWYRGKSLDNYSAMGPCILYKDELDHPIELDISTKVNGEIRQESNTRNFINNIGAIIEEISNGITLEPGDIIVTGTPSGVGARFNPPKFLKPGDIVQCEIEKIGKLINKIN